VIENFKNRGDDTNILHKAVINPRFAIELGHTHSFRMAGNTVDENFEIIDLSKSVALPKNKIRINHYHTKSVEEYEKKIPKGDAVFGQGLNRFTDEHFAIHDRNEIYDNIMDRYIEAVKQKLRSGN
jgi:hypothetical protein